MPGYPTRQTLRTPLQACRRRGCVARASAATGIRKRRSRAERGASMPGPRAAVPARPKAVQANLSGPRSAPTTRYCSRQIATVSQAEHQTPEMHDAGEHPARMCGRPLPWTEAGVHARAAGARAGRPQRASRELRPRRPHPRRQQHSASFTGPLRVRRASAEMARPTRAAPVHRWAALRTSQGANASSCWWRGSQLWRV
jgi:hypothetical protein